MVKGRIEGVFVYIFLVFIVGVFSGCLSFDGIVKMFSIKRDDVDCLF